VVFFGALAACGKVTYPVEAVDHDGTVFRGTGYATIQEGAFSLSSEAGTTCGGTYDPMSSSKRITAQVGCSDGRQGTAEIVRDNDLRGGAGVIRFQDGTEARAVFGEDRVSG